MLSIFLAAALPLIPGKAIPLIGYPIFWEFTAGIIFIIAILVFLAVIKRPIRVTKRNCQKYLDVTYKIIASNKESFLKQFAIEIACSIKPVIKMANKTKNDIETIKKAHTLLILWSDKSFCKTIVNHAILTLYTAINCVKSESNYENVPSQAFIQELIRQSITSDNSLLNRENEFYGLGLFKNMTMEIFGNYEFVISKYRPLDFKLKFYKEDGQTTIRYIKNYFMCLNTSLSSCIKNRAFKAAQNPFGLAFEEISRLSTVMASKLRNISEDIASDSHPYLILSEISRGFDQMLNVIYEYEIESDFNEEGYDYLYDQSIYGVVAWGLFKFFTSLSTCLAHDNLIRGLAVSIWLDVAGEVKENDQILKRMILHLKGKVNDNLTKGRYPMVIRLLLSLDGLAEPQMNPEKKTKIILFNYVMESLKTNYKLIFDKDPILAKVMLPENVTYDSQEQLLMAKYFLSEDSTLKVGSEQLL